MNTAFHDQGHSADGIVLGGVGMGEWPWVVSVNLNCNHKNLYKEEAEREETQKRKHVPTDAETRGTWLPGQECQQPVEAGRGKPASLQALPTPRLHAMTMTSDFWPLGLYENKLG